MDKKNLEVKMTKEQTNPKKRTQPDKIKFKGAIFRSLLEEDTHLGRKHSTCIIHIKKKENRENHCNSLSNMQSYTNGTIGSKKN